MTTDTTQAEARSRWTRTAAWLAALVALHLTFAAVMLVVVPRQKKTFDEYHMQLPAVTKSVLTAGSLYARWWWVALPTLLSGTVIGVVVGRHAFRRPTVGTVIALVCLVGLTGGLGVVVCALALPQLKLAEGLSK